MFAVSEDESENVCVLRAGWGYSNKGRPIRSQIRLERRNYIKADAGYGPARFDLQMT